jgi:hypothetical protein
MHTVTLIGDQDGKPASRKYVTLVLTDESKPSVGCRTTARGSSCPARSHMRLVLLILLILLVLGALPTWPYSAHWGYYPSGGLGLLLIILIVVMIAG